MERRIEDARSESPWPDGEMNRVSHRNELGRDPSIVFFPIRILIFLLPFITDGSDRAAAECFHSAGRFFICTRRGGISGAALASSPLWPRCAAFQPGNLRFAVGEALSHDARSDALRPSEK